MKTEPPDDGDEVDGRGSDGSRNTICAWSKGTSNCDGGSTGPSRYEICKSADSMEATMSDHAKKSKI